MPNQPMTYDELMQQIKKSWDALYTYIDSLTEVQLTQPKDAAGWTVKDHLVHLAVWENAVLALLERKPKRETLDIDPETWDKDDDSEAANAILHQRYHEMPLAEVRQTLQQNHALMVEKLMAMTEADLRLPYHHYQADTPDERPLIQWLPYETAYHYDEHLPWIKAIIDGA